MTAPFYERDGITLYCGDTLDVLRSLTDRFDLVFTSPPYNLGTTTGGGFGHYAADAKLAAGGTGRRGGGHKWHGKRPGGLWNGGDLSEGYDGHADALPMGEYERWQRRCVAAMWRHLTDTGAIFYNHKPRPQRTLWHPRCLIPPSLPVRQEIIWARGSGMNFAPTHYVPTYEVVIVIAKDAWRLKSKGASGIGDVWSTPPESGSPHPAPFPLALPTRAIETAAPGSVLDPFTGSGTTAEAAVLEGARFVGCELTAEYLPLIDQRIARGYRGGPDYPDPVAAPAKPDSGIDNLTLFDL